MNTASGRKATELPTGWIKGDGLRDLLGWAWTQMNYVNVLSPLHQLLNMVA